MWRSSEKLVRLRPGQKKMKVSFVCRTNSAMGQSWATYWGQILYQVHFFKDAKIILTSYFNMFKNRQKSRKIKFIHNLKDLDPMLWWLWPNMSDLTWVMTAILRSNYNSGHNFTLDKTFSKIDLSACNKKKVTFMHIFYFLCELHTILEYIICT